MVFENLSYCIDQFGSLQVLNWRELRRKGNKKFFFNTEKIKTNYKENKTRIGGQDRTLH